MALQIVNFTRTVQLDLGTTDSVLVGRNGVVASDVPDTAFQDNSIAIKGAGSTQFARVEGTVAALAQGGIGIYLGLNAVQQSLENVFIAATGVVTAFGAAVTVTAEQSRIINYGMLEGTTGISFGSDGSGLSHIENHGTILGAAFGIYCNGSERVTIVNTGDITGAVYSMFLKATNDIVRNSGHLYGDLALNNGDDLYNGRGGTIEGVILGGAGNDTFVLGAGEETVDGGVGSDTLDFRKGGAIHVALDGSFANTGAAADDDYSNIENILGSRFGADSLAGDGGANALSGFGGADVLMGGSGNDTLTGGLGADKLTGGLGNDQFLFNTVDEAGDKITDFTATLRDNDSFAISAAGFGAGLVAGLLPAVQFQARADNVAQDADDRFIFDTVRHQLWFDANGSAFGGLTLIATLNANAVLTAADILIV